MQAASANRDPNYHDAEAGQDGSERPALGKNASANTVLAKKDHLTGPQRGQQ